MIKGQINRLSIEKIQRENWVYEKFWRDKT